VRTEIRNTQPFLTRFATVRDQTSPIPGRYSADADLWTVSTEGLELPIIEISPDLIEITTKTKVLQESDDSAAPMLEIQTKTATNIESDDDPRAYAASCMLEITTKTDAQMESDDTSPRVHGFL